MADQWTTEMDIKMLRIVVANSKIPLDIFDRVALEWNALNDVALSPGDIATRFAEIFSAAAPNAANIPAAEGRNSKKRRAEHEAEDDASDDGRSSITIKLSDGKKRKAETEAESESDGGRTDIGRSVNGRFEIRPGKWEDFDEWCKHCKRWGHCGGAVRCSFYGCWYCLDKGHKHWECPLVPKKST
ncbi:hypothetical protein EJ08DRAFT_199893 [Tothia fuscella]|uniref:Uncharacterized protein n=1 Tax=Tothia fuscella TaxID=1048955 RepID=A0A9P4TYW4_9PEZI|nr:hypothetical protein EJ08DRAFT_199893 [Tothia fuscella]